MQTPEGYISMDISYPILERNIFILGISIFFWGGTFAFQCVFF